MHIGTAEGSYSIIALFEVLSTDVSFTATISKMYRDFRREALLAPGPNAQGGWTLVEDMKRSEDSYLGELTDPRVYLYIWLRNSPRGPPSSKAAKRDALLSCRWVGMTWFYGPLTPQEWSLPTAQLPTKVKRNEVRYHQGGTYAAAEIRRLRDTRGQLLSTSLMLGSYHHMEDLVRHGATTFPVYVHFRGTIRPDQDNRTDRLENWYRKHMSAVSVGRIPEITSMITNTLVMPQSMPGVKEKPGFYSACNFVVMERITELHRDGSRVSLGPGGKAVL